MKQDIYLAGGCFWAVEHLYSLVYGVISVTSGYVNGYDDKRPTYEEVCYMRTGFKEAVHVEYDDKKVSLEYLLFIFFSVIDPTTPNRQGADRGYQYQAGIYYIDDYSKGIINKIINIEKEKYTPFAVEVEEMRNFYDAEEYHQKYLYKNPHGYCHIHPARMEALAKFRIDKDEYTKPARDILDIQI